MISKAWGGAAIAGVVIVVGIALVGRPGAAPSGPAPEPLPTGEGRPSPESEGAGRLASETVPCRCLPLDLAEYFDTADEVAFARLVSFEESNRYRTLQMVLEAPLWKSSEMRAGQLLLRGDTVQYRTAISTATCGVMPEIEAVYVAFGRWSPQDTRLDVDSCSGTRVHRRASGDGELGGFQDVPGRFVVRQLNALAGLAALTGLGPLPDPGDPERAVLRGLLDLAPLAHGGRVRVFARPTSTADVLATLGNLDGLVTREVGYELGAAVVFGRTEGWSRVQLADGRIGWIAADEAGTWFPYLDLPVRRLAYLTPAWSGFVWPEPGAGIPNRPERAAANRREQPAEVLESRLVGGFPWFRVAVLDRSPCEGPEDPRTVAGGWVAGYGTAPDSVGLQPTIWYSSRGC